MALKKKPISNPLASARADGFSNPFTGAGGSTDRRTYSYYRPDVSITDDTLDSIFHGNDLAARICEIGPEEMMRQGFELKVGGADEGQDRYSKMTSDIMAICKRLYVNDKFTDAGVWANVFGGSALFLGAMDGNETSEPLDEDSVESLNFITVMDKRDLTPSSWYGDPLLPNYGKPATYRIQPSAVTGLNQQALGSEIHESRLIIFNGTRTSLRRKQSNQGWGISLLQRVWEVLGDFNQTWGSMATLVQGASQGIFKVKDLALMMSEDNNRSDLRLQSRVASIDMAMSNNRSIMVDAEFEDYRRETTPLTGFTDMMDQFMMRLGSAARVPVSILLGKQPTGALNASLNAEMRWFYDSIKAQQINFLKPKLERFIKVIMLCRDGPTRGEVIDFEISFPPLWQANQLEESQVRLAISQADVAYIQAGVLLPEEVAISRFRPEGFSTETIVDLESRAQELDFQRRQPAPIKILAPTQETP